jgi:hypothetical protein
MMMNAADRSRARRLELQRKVLLVVAVLVSAATAVVVGFAMYLFVEAYAGGSQSLGGLAFVLGCAVLVVAGLPGGVASGLAWAGYAAAARRSHCIPR